MLGAVFGHLFEQRLGLCLDDGQLEEHGGVEHGVGVFLEGEYPSVLSGAHTGPSAYGFAG